MSSELFTPVLTQTSNEGYQLKIAEVKNGFGSMFFCLVGLNKDHPFFGVEFDKIVEDCGIFVHNGLNCDSTTFPPLNTKDKWEIGFFTSPLRDRSFTNDERTMRILLYCLDSLSKQIKIHST